MKKTFNGGGHFDNCRHAAAFLKRAIISYGSYENESK